MKILSYNFWHLFEHFAQIEMKILKLFTQTIIHSIILCGFCIEADAQAVVAGNTNTNGSNTGAITTAVPFLTISPDARSGAMGDEARIRP